MKTKAHTKPVKEIRDIIKTLDEGCIDIHPNVEYIKGMIMGLAFSINYKCTKPTSISDEIWKNAIKSSKEPEEKTKEINSLSDIMNIIAERGA